MATTTGALQAAMKRSLGPELHVGYRPKQRRASRQNRAYRGFRQKRRRRKIRTAPLFAPRTGLVPISRGQAQARKRRYLKRYPGGGPTIYN